jgi:hypothetical protein
MRAAVVAARRQLGRDRFSVLRTGWPDLIAFRNNRNYYFIECKRIDEKSNRVDEILKPEQNEMRRILERLGRTKMRYEIWFFESKPGSTRLVEKAFCHGNDLVPYWPGPRD